MGVFKKEFVDEGSNYSAKWIFDDNGVTIEEKRDEKQIENMENGRILHCFCPYGNIKCIESNKYIKAIDMTFFDKKYDEHRVRINCEKHQSHDIKGAVKFAQKQSKANQIEPEKFQVFKEVSNNKFDKGEYIMQCQICGQVFRYTNTDLERNKQIKKEAEKLQNQALIDSIGFNTILSSIDSQRAENKLNTMRDYFSCPKCKSTKLKRISEEELNQIKENKNASTSTVSSADELKKFKELLDIGVITQEEFDAKKKQLLGL